MHRVSIIVAIDEKRGIGKGNDLLFKIPEDFVRMKKLTTGHPLIMGRKTFESIGRPLPNRTNIVVTRDQAYRKDGIVVVTSLEEAIEHAKKSPGNEEIFIFGGGQIFAESLKKNLVDRLYLTIVKGDFGADIFFPEYANQFPKVVAKDTHQNEKYQYTFLDLEK